MHTCVQSCVHFLATECHMHMISTKFYNVWQNDSCCLPTQNGNTALHGASSEGHKDTVELLLLRGAQVDSQDNVSMCVLRLNPLIN